MQPPDKGKGKRVAPISSSAFSFSLGGTPIKKARNAEEKEDNDNNNKATSTKKEALTSAARSPAVTRMAQTLSRTPVKPPITTPLRPERRDGPDAAKPSPRPQTMGPPPSLTLTPRRQPPNTAQTTPTSARRSLPSFSLTEASPKGLGPVPSERSRPLAPVSGGSPFRLTGNSSEQAPKAEDKRMQSLSSLSQVKPQVSASAPTLPSAETISGVSPRKRKSTRKFGEGLSARLSSLIASADTALILFYTSLLRGGRTLSGDALKRRMNDAPVLLQVARTLRGPTPSATLAHCKVLRWTGAAHAAEDNVMVVFKALPQECPRIGRALERIDETTQAAVWFPTSEVVLQAQSDPEFESDMSGVRHEGQEGQAVQEGRDGQDGQDRQDVKDGQDVKNTAPAHGSQKSDQNAQKSAEGHLAANPADRPDVGDRPLPVVFASRYLLVGT